MIPRSSWSSLNSGFFKSDNLRLAPCSQPKRSFIHFELISGKKSQVPVTNRYTQKIKSTFLFQSLLSSNWTSGSWRYRDKRGSSPKNALLALSWSPFRHTILTSENFSQFLTSSLLTSLKWNCLSVTFKQMPFRKSRSGTLGELLQMKEKRQTDGDLSWNFWKYSTFCEPFYVINYSRNSCGDFLDSIWDSYLILIEGCCYFSHG